MESLLLTMLGPAGPVVPRRVRLGLAPGEGRLHLPARPPLDAAWRASVGAAWTAACRLAGKTDQDARLEVASPNPLEGGSAGLAVGLLALGALLGETLPPHFATGGVADQDGTLMGGLAARPKAEAAGLLAPQLGMAGAVFLAPPIPDPPAPPGLPVRLAADLGGALARLHPTAYGAIAERHAALRRVDGAPPGRFALVHADPGLALPGEVAGIRVALRPQAGLGKGAWVDLGDGGLRLWRTFVPEAGRLAADLPGLHALARAGAVP